MRPHDEAFRAAEEQLRRGGIAPARARRMVQEWRDHHTDVMEDALAAGCDRVSAACTADRRLGDLQHLTEVALARRELLAAGARWPWLVYLCGPLAAYLMAMTAANVAIVVVGQTSGLFEVATAAPLAASLATLLLWLQMYAVPVFVAGTFLVLAARQRVPVHWPLTGAVLIALVGGNTVAVLVLPSAPGADGLLQLSLFYAPERHTLIDGVMRSGINALLLTGPYLFWREGLR
jgi:hypothetical protein